MSLGKVINVSCPLFPFSDLGICFLLSSVWHICLDLSGELFVVVHLYQYQFELGLICPITHLHLFSCKYRNGKTTKCYQMLICIRVQKNHLQETI